MYILSVVSIVTFSLSSFPIDRFPVDKRKASRPHISNPARVHFTPCGRKISWTPNKGMIEIVVLVLMKINDSNDRITNTFAVQVAPKSLFSTN